MKTILFQGDSITDCGRSREVDNNRGLGYPTLLAGQIGFDHPEEYQFLNRGISGNRIVDLYARIKMDFINLKPDVLSILIGINDVWHELGNRNGVDAVKFERIYGMLIEEILEACPDTKIMILEPFVLCGAATEEQFSAFDTETKLRAQAAKRVAERFRLTFVPLQEKFDEASKRAPATYWTPDGVHPSTFGHELIAHAWLKAFQML